MELSHDKRRQILTRSPPRTINNHDLPSDLLSIETSPQLLWRMHSVLQFFSWFVLWLAILVSVKGRTGGEPQVPFQKPEWGCLNGSLNFPDVGLFGMHWWECSYCWKLPIILREKNRFNRGPTMLTSHTHHRKGFKVSKMAFSIGVSILVFFFYLIQEVSHSLNILGFGAVPQALSFRLLMDEVSAHWEMAV